MKSILLAFALFAVMTPTSAGAVKPILNMIDVPVPIRPDGSSIEPEEVQAIIIEACLARRWLAVVGGDGMIRATLNVRNKHFAEVEIPYTTSAYSITYVSSDNLDYDKRRKRIHRNYNNWVLKLSRTIDKFLRRPMAKPEPEPVTVESKSDIYAEIIKLDDLRERGLLTDEEFENEKRKLLMQD